MSISSIRSQKYFLLFIAVILLGTALRFYRVSEMSLRADEAMTLFYATDLSAIFHQLTTDDPHLPLYYLVLHNWLLLGGTSELSLRFPTIWMSILIVPLGIRLSRTLFPRQLLVALIAGWLLAFNPYLIWDGQDAYLYAFLTALTIASLIMLHRGTESPSKRTWVGYIFVCALMLYFHYFAAFILIAQGIWIIYLVATQRCSRSIFLSWVAAQCVIGAIFLPWVWFALPVLTGFKTDFLPVADLFEMVRRSIVSFTVGRSDVRLAPTTIDPFIGSILALGFLPVFILGLVQSQYLRSRVALSLYLVIPILIIYLVSILRFPTYDERYVIYLAPAFLLLVARGIARLLWLPKTKRLGIVMLGFVGVASAYSLYNYWYVPEFAKSPDWRGFVTIIATDAQPGDALIQNYPDPALPYYLQNRLPRILLPRSGSQNDNALNEDLIRITAKYQRVWFQAAPGSTWDSDGRVADWLLDHVHRLRVYSIRGARLELFSTEPRQ